MSAVDSLKRTVLGGATAMLLLVLAATSSAQASSPWWHLTSGTRSTIQPGSAADQTFELTHVTSQFTVEDADNQKEATFEGGATATELQHGLEGLYGAGNVTVSGATGGPYEIRFVGGLADQAVRLTCRSCEGAPALAETAKGHPDGEVIVTASNLGDANAEGGAAPINIVDELPPGLHAVAIEAAHYDGDQAYFPLSCSLGTLSCKYGRVVPSYTHIEERIGVVVESTPPAGAFNEARIAGGGAPSESVRRALGVTGTPPQFGVESYELSPEEEGGGADSQAGSHPFQLTTTLVLSQHLDSRPFEVAEGESPTLTEPVKLTKDLHFKLPPGLLGNPTPVPRCSIGQFLTTVGESSQAPGNSNECPPQTAVGVAVVDVDVYPVGALTLVQPVFNLEPAVGEPARFGFFIPLAGAPVILDTSVRTGEDYGVTVSVDNITQTVSFLSSQVTFWGVPSDPRHNLVRGWGCLEDTLDEGVGSPGRPFACSTETVSHAPPFLSMPTSCTGPMPTAVEVDPWAEEGNFTPFPSNEPIGALDGCNRLPFSPSISLTPDGQAGSTPTGLDVGIHVPQDLVLNPTGLAEATVKDTEVVLPEGVALNPAAADGLQSCPESDFPLDNDAEATCPEASKVATVQIKTPLLANPLNGYVYLAAQDANPFGSLVALYLLARDPVSGTLIKLAGEVGLNPITGRLVSTFKNTPQLPFEELKVHFFGGDRAPLRTPARCGGYTTNASIAPWSGSAPVNAASEFQILTGPNGGPCRDPLQFNPSLTAGTTSIQAGGFSPFTMTMSREDGQQNMQGIELHMPLGLSGTLSNVKLCGEEQANAGTCGPESEIGETIISVGVGGDPYTVKGGKVYITGPYKGAPFGLSIVNPAKAGPYDLGKVVVRAKLEVNRETAALTVTTDNEGPYKIPTIIDGIPLEIRHVNVSINRPDFTFNATNCTPTAITGKLTSTEGAAATLSVPYQVTNCAVLAFKPKLQASTSGRPSRANGTSLNVKLGYPAGPYDANIARVKVELPKQLPSRLSTLQKACLAKVFEANPASCPAASVIGHATATTPVLPVPLTGPAYFVSHGGEAFPSLVIVLQGYGVTVDLVGTTYISKAGITSSTFKTVPDVPVGKFELNLPAGPYSALTTLGNVCKAKSLAMPTEFLGQNGALIKTTTKIAVTGCPKAKRAARRKARAHGHKGKAGGHGARKRRGSGPKGKRGKT